MKKAEMTAEQLAFRQSVIGLLTAQGWSGPREEQAFEADLILETELSLTKRNAQCLMEFRYSFEYDYLAFLVAQPLQGHADYILYHRGLPDSLTLMQIILAQVDQMSFESSLEVFRELCRERPGDIYFFDGAQSLELTPENMVDIVKGNPTNRVL
ncbi:hypothetical protein [Deinococcus aquatilis]|uniref:hypothetical protein n=1 Tax=Deinococcus aquatilis TaxID=519440 RepID=UPI000370DC6B|nr:hypothetical protein [Deinococcus aquatilis]